MGNIRILYLDKDDFIGSQVKLRLEWKGHQVTVMNSDGEFVTQVQNHFYDLLIIDFLTLKPAIYSFLESLKNDLPPTIVVSDDSSYQNVIKVMQLGCMDYVIKDPLIQKFVDQINLSILLLFEKYRHHKTSYPKQIQAIDDALKTGMTDISFWEYFIDTDLVKWSGLHNNNDLCCIYEEFTKKIHPDDLVHVTTQNSICLFLHKPVEYSFRFLLDNKQQLSFYAQVKAEISSQGIVTKLYGNMQVCSSQEIKNKNLQLKLSCLDNMADAVFITNAQNQIVSVNHAFTSITGYSEKEIYKKNTAILHTGKFDDTFFNKITEELKKNPFWQGETLIRHHKGHSVPVWQSSYVLKDAKGNITQSLSVLKDITKQKYYEESIKIRANYDPLTKLPNRALFLDRLVSTVKLSKRNESKFALMLLDLNKFKWLNDTLGHHAGDILLKETSRILLASVRQSDTVARLGGDEFSIIVPELVKTTDAGLIARKIFDAFKQPIFIDQREIFISGSIGITIFPDDGIELDSLQKNADSAMYIAKNNGNNSYHYYTQTLQQEVEKKLKLIEDIRSAIVNQEFTLHYQPIIDIITNKVVSAETLLRWKHPQTGYVSLDDFIPLAEESGLIREIGNWVIEEVANNIQRWTALGFPVLHISLNQSVAQYSLSQCHIEWLDILKKRQVPPSNITFEISEKIFIEEQESYLKSIDKLKSAGIQISLDSFGTGYSSLSYLKKFPVDVIKIDRSYIHSMLENSTNAVLVETIVFLANKLGIKVIATCVENKEQLALLSEQCRFAQGYYFSRPLTLIEFEGYIEGQGVY